MVDFSRAVPCNLCVRYIQNKLAAPECDVPRAFGESYAWQLLEAATGMQRAQLVRQGAILLDTQQRLWIEEALDAIIVKSKPIQYVIGAVPFLDLMLAVQPPVLIPRTETEAWVAILLATYASKGVAPSRVLDLCTGTGCIALACAQVFADACIVYGVDCALSAVALAQHNASINNINNSIFVQGDLYEPVSGLYFDLIVANPPYIAQSEYATLERSVRLWEDPGALVSGSDGLDIVRKIVTQAPRYCAPSGRLDLWIEIDYFQEDTVTQLFAQAEFQTIATWHDASGYSRVVHGTLHRDMSQASE